MLISQAYAAGGMTDVVQNFVPLIIIFVLFFFLIIRPQMKQAKALRAMLDALKVGDEVVITGGLMGKVCKVNGAVITLEIATNTEVLVQKASVQTLLDKGTLKNPV